MDSQAELDMGDIHLEDSEVQKQISILDKTDFKKSHLSRGDPLQGEVNSDSEEYLSNRSGIKNNLMASPMLKGHSD